MPRMTMTSFLKNTIHVDAQGLGLISTQEITFIVNKDNKQAAQQKKETQITNNQYTYPIYHESGKLIFTWKMNEQMERRSSLKLGVMNADTPKSMVSTVRCRIIN